MSNAKAGPHLSTISSLSTTAAIPSSAPMRLNVNPSSATPGAEGLATVSEQVCILTAFALCMYMPDQPDCFLQPDYCWQPYFANAAMLAKSWRCPAVPLRHCWTQAACAVSV